MKMFLETLTDEQKESLKLLLSDTEEEPKRSRSTRGKKNTTKKRRVVEVVGHDFEDDDDDDDDTPRSNRRRRKRSGEPKGKAARTTRLETGPRPNDLFEKSPDFKADKHLVREDKKLWAGHQPTPRERAGYVRVRCIRCKDELDVSPSLARKRYICDDCITRE